MAAIETSNKDKNHEMFCVIEKILSEEDKPSIHLTKLSKTQEFQSSVFEIMNEMKKTEQSPKHHPEGNVWNHTMMVVDEAAKVKKQSKCPIIFMWAAFLHDIGKPEVTCMRKGRITAYDHDRAGAKRAREVLEASCDDEGKIDAIAAMVRWHMQILFVAKDLAFADIESMRKEVDLEEVSLLGMCDRLGRLGVNREKVMQDIDLFRNRVL